MSGYRNRASDKAQCGDELELHYWAADSPLGRAALLFLTGAAGGGVAVAAVLVRQSASDHGRRRPTGVRRAATGQGSVDAVAGDRRRHCIAVGRRAALAAGGLDRLARMAKRARVGGGFDSRPSDSRSTIGCGARAVIGGRHRPILAGPPRWRSRLPGLCRRPRPSLTSSGTVKRRMPYESDSVTYPKTGDGPGGTADGYVMGWWDRPFDEAVDLMNEWLTRHR